MHRMPGGQTFRRHSLKVVVVAAGCAVLAACGSQVPPSKYIDAQRSLFGFNNGNGSNTGNGNTGTGNTGTGNTGTGNTGTGNTGTGNTGTGNTGTGNTGTGNTGTGNTGNGGSSGGGVIGTGPKIVAGSCAGFKNTTGISNTNITIANVADVTGPVPGLFAGAQNAMKAFVAYFNSTSSICGRKLTLQTGDSQTSESGDQQATTTACGSAFAMVGSMGAFDGGGTQEVEKCGIPDLRAAVTESARLAAPEVFATQSLNSNYEPDAPADYYKQAFGEDVITHAGFVYLNAGAAASNAATEIKGWTARGFKFVYTAGIPVTEFNYTSFVSAMQQKGVKYVQYVGAYQEAVSLAQAMQQQNFTAKLVFDPEVYNQGFVQSGGSAVNGAHVWINSQTFENIGSIPEMQLYQKWLNIVAPGKPLDYFGLFSWAAGELFVQEAIKLGGQLTRASLINALKSVDNYTGNGLFGPQHVGSHMTGGCYGFITLQNGKWVREGKSPFLCEGLSHV